MTQRRILGSVQATSIDLKTLREQSGLTQGELGQKTGYSEKTIRRWESGTTPPRGIVVEYLKNTIATRGTARVSEVPPSFTFVDLFAGIGGLRRGFEAVGGKCLFTSEWDKYAQRTYRANFGETHPIAGDIVQIASQNIPAHDVLLAGFPCQPFSIAGVSKKNALGQPHGFACDTQGTLFFEVARILSHHRPKAFLLENVKNLISHDQGKTFLTIKKVLEQELGYHIFCKVIDARVFLPQHRERIIIVGFRDETGFSWDDFVLPDRAKGPRLKAVLHPEDGTEEPDLACVDEMGRVLPRYTLSEHLWNYLQEYAARHRKKGNGFGFGLVGPCDVSRTLSARYYKDGSEILVKRDDGPPRRLTPRECARLMGFDTPQFRMKIPVSDTQAYKQFGNSVAVPVITAVAKHMVPHIVGKSQPTQLVLPLRSKSA
jgi:DNA (cytosine-5)-methyltransferase 1